MALCVVLAGALQVGDSVPDITLQEGTPGDTVKLRDLFKGAHWCRSLRTLSTNRIFAGPISQLTSAPGSAGKKGILFGVPGAFTPGPCGPHCTLIVSRHFFAVCKRSAL